jgi:hypothetical protein
MANGNIFIVGGVPMVHVDSLENRRMANDEWQMGIFSLLVVCQWFMLALQKMEIEISLPCDQGEIQEN